MTDLSQSSAPAAAPRSVQILAIIGFTGFAIPVSIVAMSEFGVLGLGLAAFLGWQWTRIAGLGNPVGVSDMVSRLTPNLEGAPRPSGNASFDAYRSELMERLETEQTNFEGFLVRLRDAKDQTEFDGFLSDRERLQREARETVPA